MKRAALIFLVCMAFLCGCQNGTATDGGTDPAEEGSTVVPESKIHVIKQEDCPLEDGGILRLSVLEMEGEKNLYVDVVIPGDERACVTFATLCAFFEQDPLKDWYTNCSVKTDSGSVMYIEKQIIGINSDGTTSSGEPDWFISAPDLTMEETEREGLKEEVESRMAAFLEGGI